jgi:hypothetical protein
VKNGETRHQHLRQMPAEWINFLRLGVGFLEHPKLDVAVRSAKVQLIRTSEGHEVER